MQNSHVKWRIDFAQQLAQRLAAFEGIQAIVIAGSVARGYADEFSDIELPIFWKSLPDDATRHAVVNALNGQFLYGYDGPAHEDQLLIDGVQVDLWDVSSANQEQILDSVLIRHEYDLGALNALDTTRFCIPLFGHDLVQKWKFRAQEYPDELAMKIVQEHAASFSVADLFLLVQRDNPTAFYARLCFLQQEAFLVLLALNRRYFPTFKWLFRALESMPVKPDALDHRFRSAFEVPRMEAVADTQRVLKETLDLAKDQFPQMDLTKVYHRLAYMRDAQTTEGKKKR
jgi:hypothetical protein